MKSLNYFADENYPNVTINSDRVQKLIDAILKNPLLILHSELGIGKSSLLKSEVITILEKSGHDVIYLDLAKDSIQLLLSTFSEFGNHGKPGGTKSNKPVASQEYQNSRKHIIILDSFSKLIHLNSELVVKNILDLLTQFFDPLNSPYNTKHHVVLSIRTDFLPDLKSSASHLLDYESTNYYHLERMNKIEAYQLLLFYEDFHHIKFQETLQQKIIQDYLKFKLTTFELIILLTSLVNYSRELSKFYLPSTPITIDLLQEMGGSQKITKNFIDIEIDRLADSILANESSRPMSRNKPRKSSFIKGKTLYKLGLRNILSCFIVNRRISFQVNRKAVINKVLTSDIGLTRNKIRRLFAGLVSCGYIKKIKSPEPTYILANDSLVLQIQEWNDGLPDNQIKINARLYCARQISECIIFDRYLTKSETEAFTEKAEEASFSTSELALIFKSSLISRQDPDYWFNYLENEMVNPSSMIEVSLNDVDYRTKVNIIKSLSKLSVDVAPIVIDHVNDTYPQVRSAVVSVLQKCCSGGRWMDQLHLDSFIPAGLARLGSTEGFADEGPVNEVQLDSFFINKYLITFLDYARYMEDIEMPYTYPLGMDRYPVVNLTWYEAREYARWGNLRLPTEAEWEKTASMPSGNNPHLKRRYPWGSEFDERNCNMRASKLSGTTPVGRYSPQGDSAAGCADMAGNVWEWTQSVFKQYPYIKTDGREAVASIGSRVIRGGSFQSGATYVTCSVRQAFDPFSKRVDIGFRCVLEIQNTSDW